MTVYSSSTCVVDLSVEFSRWASMNIWETGKVNGDTEEGPKGVSTFFVQHFSSMTDNLV